MKDLFRRLFATGSPAKPAADDLAACIYWLNLSKESDMLRQLFIVVPTAVCVLVSGDVFAQNLILSAPGSYVLAADSISTNAFMNVRIDADDVTFNLNGKTIRCAPSSPATAVNMGIYAAGRSRITIKNGTISGCFFGVHGGYGSRITLEDVNLSGNTYIGVNVGGSPNTIIRRVTCDRIEGYTVEAYAVCVNGLDASGLVEDSHFLNLYRQPTANGVGEGVGVLVAPNATNVIIRRNEFHNAAVDTATYGVWSALGGTMTVTDNTFHNIWRPIAAGGHLTATLNDITLDEPIAGSIAIAATDGSASGNTISANYATPLEGVTDGGNTIGNPPSPPAPPSGGKFFRICVDGVCYEGTLVPVSGQ